MSFISSILWFCTSMLIAHSYILVNHRGTKGGNHVPSSPTNDVNTNNDIQSLQTAGSQELTALTNSQQAVPESNTNADAANALKSLCRKLCSNQTCPPECSEVFLDPWTVVKVPYNPSGVSKRRNSGLDGLTNQTCPPECSEVFLDPWTVVKVPYNPSGVSKRRNSGLDGLTFDDYLFMQWLGRDINRRRLQ